MSDDHEAAGDPDGEGGPDRNGDGPPDEAVEDLEAATRDASPEARARAIQSLLVEQGRLTVDAVDEIVSTYENDLGPLNGARVVARAWTDPDYRDRLLADATEAVRELGIEVDLHNVVLEAVENTDDVHNLVVCTLCSCYPWAVLGLPPTWYKSEAYRARAVREPRTLLRQDFGLDLGGEVDVRVWDSTSELRYFVVPQRPPGTEGFEEDDLVELVTRDAMIGVDRLTEPPASDGGVRPRSAAATFGVDLDREPTFRAPWQARAFAVAVALADDAYDWDAFQGRLVAETERAAAVDDPGEGGPGGDPDAAESAYYERWLSALEATLVDRGLLVPETLRARAAEFEAGDRTAEEFVEGDRHHTHGEGDGHGRGHGDHHGHGHGHEHRDHHGHRHGHEHRDHQGGGGHHDHDHDHDDRGHRHDR